MKNVFVALVFLMFLASCEKTSTHSSKVYCTIDLGEVPTTSSDFASITATNLSKGTVAHIDWNQPMKSYKSEVVEMEKGTRLYYEFMYGGETDPVTLSPKAFTDITVKLYVGNKVKFEKVVSKGAVNQFDGGSFIIE